MACKWSYTPCVPLSLAPFTWLNVSEVYPCCRIDHCFIPFDSVFHCIWLLIIWWTLDWFWCLTAMSIGTIIVFLSKWSREYNVWRGAYPNYIAQLFGEVMVPGFTMYPEALGNRILQKHSSGYVFQTATFRDDSLHPPPTDPVFTPALSPPMKYILFPLPGRFPASSPLTLPLYQTSLGLQIVALLSLHPEYKLIHIIFIFWAWITSLRIIFFY